MGEKIFSVTILGARGSIPVSGKEYNLYGGETSCYMVELGKQVIFLDAGTGIINAPDLKDKDNVYIILSHPHLDHIIGLPFFPELSKKDKTITLFGKRLKEKSIEHQIEKAFSKPYWPLTIAEYPSNIIYKDLEIPLELQNGEEKILVEAAEVNHPGGCLSFKITYMGKKLVYITDCELQSKPESNLIDYAKDADLILFDAQYTEKEYETKKGFGHSTLKMAKEFKELTNSKKMILIHHDPKHNDSELKKMEDSLKETDISYAKKGMKIDIL
ncbi:MBL fold metallo-hydrolase [Butyrivibrio sp. INlla16]|uniref:MBL fold metallo-hydrolase n=1 Tax=Butyrivibrio sp. INlla16 TaxID=1520807 RepID=UPI00088D6922|nr:MBL fold metallo-hydrolase [Butyrivibrio sp. INlla16]SDB65552.1 Phosphoribosyl 1,2-cyclic phosphodiesterase [Butyrivibrio sp. INlla16]